MMYVSRNTVGWPVRTAMEPRYQQARPGSGDVPSSPGLKGKNKHAGLQRTCFYRVLVYIPLKKQIKRVYKGTPVFLIQYVYMWHILQFCRHFGPSGIFGNSVPPTKPRTQPLAHHVAQKVPHVNCSSDPISRSETSNP